ncbi:MAG: hypothetical protein ISS69_04010 [Phycisphaerae bacterium]|nr:hypothetical protein [Planctomycetota bacterium]MBL7219257.1 hypothetical protein [Phycisphaerae bacterium]
MNNDRYPRQSGLLCLGLLMLTVMVGGAPHAMACQTPVFRYALERWPGDYYPLMIYHDRPLSPDGRAIVNWLEKVQETEGSQVSVYVLDISKGVTTQPVTATATTQPASRPSPVDAQRAYLLKKFPPPTDIPMPAMVLRYPAQPGPEGPVWPVVHSGRLDGKIAREIIDSPVRKKIAKRLLSGDSTVWVLLESGDKGKDAAAAKMLETELGRMTRELQLPEQPPTPDAGPYGQEISVELKLAFSLLQVSRDDPAERMFIKMLLGSEEGLAELAEPIAFPIFGRGRALAAFAGKGICTENIEDACVFLIGRCSCQVKSGNPGTDMMFSVNWDAALAGQPLMTVPPLPRLTSEEVEVATIQPRAVEAEKGSIPLLLIIGISLLAVLVVVGLPLLRVIRKGADN